MKIKHTKIKNSYIGIGLLFVFVVGLAIGVYYPTGGFARIFIPWKTIGWNTYEGYLSSYKDTIYSKYSFMYPPNCIKEQNYSNVLSCPTTHGKAKMHIDAGGHGGGDEAIRIIKDNEHRRYAAGEVVVTLFERVKERTISGTYWMSKTDNYLLHTIFGIELYSAPIEDLHEVETLMDAIFRSLRLIEHT
jgi:hypothetical protein